MVGLRVNLKPPDLSSGGFFVWKIKSWIWCRQWIWCVASGSGVARASFCRGETYAESEAKNRPMERFSGLFLRPYEAFIEPMGLLGANRDHFEAFLERCRH